MFKSIFGLSLHLKNKHSLEFKNTCQIFNKGFNHSVQYRYHCASHLKVSLDKCMFCKAEFTSHGSLKRYLQLCYNIKPNTFVSDVTFPQKYRLREHIKGKHQEPRYVCQFCGKKFKWRSSFKAHLRHSHANEDL